MLSALSITTAGMQSAADRLEDVAIGIANPTQEHARQPSFKSQDPIKAEEPIAPASATPSLDISSRQMVDLIETEMAFKASALATRSLISTSQELMEALR